MNHYCTYFDHGFAAQGRVLWNSLREHDAEAVLWVLALDDEVGAELASAREASAGRLCMIELAQLEDQVPELRIAKANRSRVEYYFTLTPVYCEWLMHHDVGIEALVYLDADLMFFGAAAPIWTTLRRGSILTVEHRFPEDLRHFERHGRFNVGVLGWRRDSNGLGCLRWWRERCLEWCHDRLEDGKYADQGYLDAWPERFAGVVVAEHPGINLAPWNWRSHVVRVTGDSLEVDGWPLVVYHFAALKALGNGRWNSGQLDYGVMPLSMIHAIYGPYLSALMAQSQTERGSATVRNRFAWRRRVWLYLFGAIWRRAWNGELTVEGGWLPGASSGRWLARWRREAK